MSITVERPTSSIARAEYSARELANNWNRSRLIIGAAMMPAPAIAADRSISRRDIFFFSFIRKKWPHERSVLPLLKPKIQSWHQSVLPGPAAPVLPYQTG